MYAVAAALDPDRYLALARAVYAEMVLAGYTVVGEFHYLHHAPGGRPYADRNAMGAALVQAATEAGIRLTLLDTCYLAGGLGAAGHEPLDPVQARFSDGDVAAWAARAGELGDGPTVRTGVAAHSVRAVPEDALAVVAAAAGDRPRHVHLSEQPAENEATSAHYGCSPTELLARTGFLGSDGDRGARDPPERSRLASARPLRHQLLPLPDHRTGPGRRDRSGPGPAGRRLAADPRLRLPGRGGPVRGAPRPGDARAAADHLPGPVHPGRAAGRGDPGRVRQPGLGRRRGDRGRGAGGLRRGADRLGADGRRRPGPDRVRRDSRRRRPGRGGRSDRGGRRRSTGSDRSARCWRRALEVGA